MSDPKKRKERLARTNVSEDHPLVTEHDLNTEKYKNGSLPVHVPCNFTDFGVRNSDFGVIRSYGKMVP